MWFFGSKGPSGFSSSSTAEEVTQGIDGSALTAIVTGASSGIGVETTRVLALRGVLVVMAVRNVDAGRNVKEAILKEIPGAKIDVMELDLSSMASIRKFASQYQSSNLPLNLLINNAGVVTPFMLSHDGIELQFATNYLGPFLLTDLLLETMKKTARESNIEGRIVNVSSIGHRFTYSEGIRFDKFNDESGYSSWYAYGQSKLATILHAKELSRRLKEDGVEITANSLHPGGIPTNIVRHDRFMNGFLHLIGKYFLKSIPQGAATTCYVALHPQVKGVSGEFFMDSNISNPSSMANDVDLAKKLWDFSFTLINPKMNVKGCKIRQTLKKMQLPRYNISWWSHLRLMRLPRYNIKAGGCFLSLMMKKRPNEVMARIYNGKMQIPKSSMALRGAAMAGGACIGRQRATPFVLSSSPLFFRVRSLHSPSHPLLRFTSFPNPKTGFKYQIRAIQEVTADTVKSQKGKEDDEQSSPQNWKIKMLYDGDCPLCMREVDMLRERNKQYGTIKFVDISSDDYSPEENQGLDYKTVMGRIHAILSDGTVVTDVEAFRKLYEQVGLGWVYAITKYEPIAAIADSIYGVWAKYRLQITGRPPLEEVLETRRKKKADICNDNNCKI